MDAYLVYPAKELKGNVAISGAKNAVLPMMAAAMLAQGVSRIQNVPDLKDVRTMADVLRVIGARIAFYGSDMTVDATHCSHFEAPYELVKTMRASFYVLGPLLARYGVARVSMPGGCAWGPRPIDLHLKGFEKLGARIEVHHGYVEAKANRLKGARIHFPISSVGATANILMAAVLAEGTTILDNAAVEPEIDNLAHFLVSMGAEIQGIGTRTLTITGKDELQPGNAATIPDRIEAGTFLAAGVITRSKIKVEQVEPAHLDSVLDVLRNMGAVITCGSNWVEVDATQKALTPVNIITNPYPEFPTDMQAQLMAVLSTVPGCSVVQDTIYPDRFKHLSELDRLGAKITLKDNTATITGGALLSGAPVMASDLRASAALVLAGLVADGQTEVARIYHMDRGYERFEHKLSALGARIERVQRPMDS
jgi:UDP-N-acetylglucosamine 1-carboxyvinyltransferase